MGTHHSPVEWWMQHSAAMGVLVRRSTTQAVVRMVIMKLCMAKLGARFAVVDEGEGEEVSSRGEAMTDRGGRRCYGQCEVYRAEWPPEAVHDKRMKMMFLLSEYRCSSPSSSNGIQLRLASRRLPRPSPHSLLATMAPVDPFLDKVGRRRAALIVRRPARRTAFHAKVHAAVRGG